MPPSESDATLLWDMLRHSQIALRLVEGFTEEQYMRDQRTQFAIERLVEIVGEAARGVSDEARALIPVIPWGKIVAQRHVIAHLYGGISHEKLWNVLTEHLPVLVVEVERVLAKPLSDLQEEQS